MNKVKDLVGKRFGRLMVTERDNGRDRKSSQAVWMCLCDCGARTSVIAGNLKNGSVKSCGCLRRDNTTTHGNSKKPEYRLWRAMLYRCNNPKAAPYKDYGGRGVKVCGRWASYENFIIDMGERQTPGLSLDRIDNDKGYSPKNCQWVTQTQQTRNQRVFRKNKTGMAGILWRERDQRYQATITHNGANIYLGYFPTIDKAIAARKAGEAKYWGRAPEGQAFQK